MMIRNKHGLVLGVEQGSCVDRQTYRDGSPVVVEKSLKGRTLRRRTPWETNAADRFRLISIEDSERPAVQLPVAGKLTKNSHSAGGADWKYSNLAQQGRFHGANDCLTHVPGW